MKSTMGLVTACLAVLLIAGCDRIPGMGPGTLVVDLAAVAKATGQEEAMQTKVQTAREDLNAQLVEAAKNLEQQIVQERAKFGDSPTQEEELQLQQMAQQAQQQYSQLQADAQQQAQQHQINLVLEFREIVQPFAEKIARSRGVSVIILADQTVFWVDSAVDITGDLIAALRAENVFSDTGADLASDEPDEVPVPEPAAAPAVTE